jgi:hypothetical protein
MVSIRLLLKTVATIRTFLNPTVSARPALVKEDHSRLGSWTIRRLPRNIEKK